MGFLDEVLDNVGKERGGKGFERGTHEVLIDVAEAKEKKTQKVDAASIIEVSVVGKEDSEKTAKATLWFHTEKAAAMSVSKVLGILVHNMGEEKKDAVREQGRKLFGTLKTPEEARDVAIKLLQAKMLGKEAFLVAEPKNGYATTSYGDLWHYPAEIREEKSMAEKITGGEVTDEISTDELPDFGDL